MSSPVWSTFVFWALSAWALAIAAWDLTSRRIPNTLSLGAWPVALLPLLLAGHSWIGASWPTTLYASAAAVVAGLPAYALGKLGAGDVKLMVAMALLTSPAVFAVSYAVAGLLSLGLLGLHTMRSQGALPDHPWVHHLTTRLLEHPRTPGVGIKLPFGALLCAGLLVAIHAEV